MAGPSVPAAAQQQPQPQTRTQTQPRPQTQSQSQSQPQPPQPPQYAGAPQPPPSPQDAGEARAVLKEGFLLRRSVTSRLGRHTWKRQYFVLDDQRSLAYYEPASGDLRGQVILTRESTVRKLSGGADGAARPHGLELSTPFVRMQLQAESARQADAWEASLNVVFREAKLSERRDQLQDVRRKARELRVPQSTGVTGRGTHTFSAGGITFEVDTRYTLLNVIGSGAYGVVVAAHDAVTGTKVAIKRVGSLFENVSESRRMIREVKLMRFLDHRNISHVRDLMRPSPRPGQPPGDFDEVYIVSDLMDTDLNRVIYSEQQLSDQHIQCLMYQLLCAVHFMASANVVHRDLKPHNLLVNAACELRVCDLGLARGMDESINEPTMYVQTRWFRAPEVTLAYDQYTTAIDMWSVGCILGELLARRPLFAGDNYLTQMQCICGVLGTPSNEDLAFLPDVQPLRYLRDLKFQPRKPWREVPGLENAPEEALDLLDRMLTFSPLRRITAEQALRHPYLRTYHGVPVESAPSKFELRELEMPNVTRQQLREALAQEIAHFRGPNAYSSASATRPGAAPSAPPSPSTTIQK